MFDHGSCLTAVFFYQADLNSVKRSELQVEFKTKEGKVEELNYLVKSLTKDSAELQKELNHKTHALAQSQNLLEMKIGDLKESTREIENLKIQVLELKNANDTVKSEANKLQAEVDQHKNEMELVMKMELTREEEVKVVVGQLEQRISELSTKLEDEVLEKDKLERMKLEMQEKLDNSTGAFEKIQEQLEAKSSLVETQKISIDNLYSQLTVSNEGFEALLKDKSRMEAIHEKEVSELGERDKKWKTDLFDEFQTKTAEEKSEHENVVKAMGEEFERAKSEIRSECETLLSKEKAKYVQVLLDQENKHQKVKSAIEEQHVLAIQVLEARAEECGMQVGSLTEELQRREIRSEELKKVLSENHKELGQMKEIVVERNDKVEKLLQLSNEKDEMVAAEKRKLEEISKELKSRLKIREGCAKAQVEERDAKILELQDEIGRGRSKYVMEIEEAGKKIGDLEQSIGDCHHTYGENISALEAEILAFKLQVVNMEDAKTEVTKKLDQMELDLVDVKQNSADTVVAFKEKLSDTQSLVKQLQGENTGLERVGKEYVAKIADLESQVKLKENIIDKFEEEQESAAHRISSHVAKIGRLEGKLSDAVTKTNLYKSRIEEMSQECLATIEKIEASKAEACASIKEYQKR